MQELYVQLKSGHRVYTKSNGSQSPRLLTLHGGPGFTHEIFANFSENLNPEGIGVALYDQLGGGRSDRPNDSKLWQMDRFVEELHEVVTQLELRHEYAFATSTGVILLIEYMLRYPNTFKGIILSGMPTSFQKFQQNVLLLRSQLPAEVLKQLKELEEEEKAGSEEYQALVFTQWYQRHFCLLQKWPEALMQCIQQAGYQVMQEMIGLSPFFFSGNLINWQPSKEELQNIGTPTLLLGFPQDVVFSEDYEEWENYLPNTNFTRCGKGGHLGWWDTPKEFFSHVLDFIRAVENNGEENNSKSNNKRKDS